MDEEKALRSQQEWAKEMEGLLNGVQAGVVGQEELLGMLIDERAPAFVRRLLREKFGTDDADAVLKMLAGLTPERIRDLMAVERQRRKQTRGPTRTEMEMVYRVARKRGKATAEECLGATMVAVAGWLHGWWPQTQIGNPDSDRLALVYDMWSRLAFPSFSLPRVTRERWASIATDDTWAELGQLGPDPVPLVFAVMLPGMATVRVGGESATIFSVMYVQRPDDSLLDLDDPAFAECDVADGGIVILASLRNTVAEQFWPVKLVDGRLVLAEESVFDEATVAQVLHWVTMSRFLISHGDMTEVCQGDQMVMFELGERFNNTTRAIVKDIAEAQRREQAEAKRAAAAERKQQAQADAERAAFAEAQAAHVRAEMKKAARQEAERAARELPAQAGEFDVDSLVDELRAADWGVLEDIRDDGTSAGWTAFAPDSGKRVKIEERAYDEATWENLHSRLRRAGWGAPDG